MVAEKGKIPFSSDLHVVYHYSFTFVQVQYVPLPAYVEGYLSVWSLSLLWLCLWIILEVRYATLAGGVALLAASCFLVPKTLLHGGTFDLSCVCTEVAWTLWKDDTAQVRTVQE